MNSTNASDANNAMDQLLRALDNVDLKVHDPWSDAYVKAIHDIFSNSSYSSPDDLRYIVAP